MSYLTFDATKTVVTFDATELFQEPFTVTLAKPYSTVPYCVYDLLKMGIKGETV